MDWQTAIYRVGSYLRHCLTARHTGGHGIHSPYLFEWVRLVMRDENNYYAWEKIEKVREEMLADTREVEFVDYGAGIGNRESENGNRESGVGSPKMEIGNRESGIRKRESGIGSRESENGKRETGIGSRESENENREARDRRMVSDIAKRSLAKKKYAQMLARLVNWLGDGQLMVVELGTSLGVTTAYMAAMDKRNKVITYEGCPAVAEIAKENWKALEIKNIDCRVGEITADMLDRDLERVDVAFIDANHTYASTRAYFNVLAEKVHPKSVIVVDDIHYNKEMEKAWHEICEDERVTSTMDLYQMGLVFFDKDYWKRDYRIRV